MVAGGSSHWVGVDQNVVELLGTTLNCSPDKSRRRHDYLNDTGVFVAKLGTTVNSGTLWIRHGWKIFVNQVFVSFIR